MNNLNSINKNYLGLLARCVLGASLLLPTSVAMLAAPRDAQSDDAKASAKSSAENKAEPIGVNLDENIRLRRDLDEYSRSVDPAHVQIEERRRVMHKRLQERFAICDRDDDGSLVLDEVFDCMPQIARRFGEIDLNSDRLITLEELEALQAKMADRQKVTAIKADAAQDNDLSGKRKNKDTSGNRKSAL